ncbi:MAG TPA: bifunctional phosphopantothenoylcysteine decarboxylase/phosphopantothenate--cysteine ligase CoaBC [Actinobacteria bacterium]|nr:bifunctional phosphopantothenoylcysteine decarboxylase/phosphopantothenate--cysteine ligase CoaBC [Actinomycetota bacterium]
MMTSSAQRFVGSATFSAITGIKTVTDLFEGGFPHIQAGQNIDLFVVAPATANTVAKLAMGVADDLVTTTALACNKPIIVCPAMTEVMWRSVITQRNIKTIQSLGHEIVGPDKGALACGEEGEGRLANSDKICEAIINRILKSAQLKLKKIMVTAGPTREYLDPVRFLSNPSSGKTGYAIAEEAARRGGETMLISGPTALTASRSIKFVPIQSALNLNDEVKTHFDNMDALIMTAAVADHRFRSINSTKRAKNSIADIELVENSDILKGCAQEKKRQILVGFAATTEDLVEHGQQKLLSKGVDFMVSTKVGFEHGFGDDSIEAAIIDSDGAQNLGLITKKELAIMIMDRLSVLL